MGELLRSRWIAGHLLAVVTVVAFVNFGFWQLRRHAEKQDLKTAVEESIVEPEVAIGNLDLAESAYRRVVAVGEYDAGIEVLVLRSYQGESGYHVLTPLRLVDGGAILVDRGWVPQEYDTPPVGPARPMEGALEVRGVVWPSQSGSVPDELPAVMKRIDAAVVDRFTAYPLAAPYLVLQEQEPPVPGGLPVIAEVPETSLGPHLGYAGQWFLFSAVVVIGYPLLLRRTVRSARRPPAAHR
jgi:surfeit locus 1 family protein